MQEIIYQCQRCGNCCKWPGFVRLTEHDMDRMARYLDMTGRNFIDTYTDLHDSRNFLVLKNKPNHECIFYNGEGCDVHPAKPYQCQAFPNRWNFPGWRDVCEAIPVEPQGDPS